MAKLRKQPMLAPESDNIRDKPTVTPRPRGISRALAATKHGKNHRLTVKQRSVVRYLMCPCKLNMTAIQASTVFNYIFQTKTLTSKMLREDWATRKNKKGGNMYLDRIITRAGTFTREEILASEEAVEQIRNACRKLEIELSDDVEMDEDLGHPTDATVLHPTVPISRLPRGTIDNYTLPVGCQPEPENYVDSSTLWREVDRSVRRRVMMCPGVGVQTRRQVNQSILRTYSVEPRVVGNTFLPVAPRYSDDSDLEGQAEDRRISRAQGAADEQQRYAQEQGRRDEERRKRAMILQGGEGQLSGSRLGRIEEDDEEKNDEQEDASRDGKNDDEEEAEDNQAGDEYADGVQQEAVGNDKFKFADLLQQDEESPHHSYNNGLANNALEYSKTDEIEVVENVSRQIRANSISSSVDDQTSRASLQARPVKDDRYIIPALNVMVSLSLAERVRIFRAAFPKLRDHEYVLIFLIEERNCFGAGTDSKQVLPVGT